MQSVEQHSALLAQACPRTPHDPPGRSWQVALQTPVQQSVAAAHAAPTAVQEPAAHALPMQRLAREKGNSVFVDEALAPYEDQWAFLGSLRRLSSADVAILIGRAEADMPGGATGVRLAQYVGRLHREHHAKREVIVYDYVDSGVTMLARMALKRKIGYRSLGYEIATAGSRMPDGLTVNVNPGNAA